MEWVRFIFGFTFILYEFGTQASPEKIFFFYDYQLFSFVVVFVECGCYVYLITHKNSLWITEKFEDKRSTAFVTSRIMRPFAATYNISTVVSKEHNKRRGNGCHQKIQCNINVVSGRIRWPFFISFSFINFWFEKRSFCLVYSLRRNIVLHISCARVHVNSYASRASLLCCAFTVSQPAILHAPQ